MRQIKCKDIYKEETSRFIKSLKHFRETWTSSCFPWSESIFQYADDDFYFYRFAVESQEKASIVLLSNILYRVMEKYGKTVEKIDNLPFNFILFTDNEKLGYRFEDFYEYEDVNSILDKYGLDRAVILRPWKPGKAYERVSSVNKLYEKEKVKLKEELIHDFYINQFGEDEYEAFIDSIDDYLNVARETIGYQSIKLLSNMNLSSNKLFEEKLLAEWDYMNYRYQIINPNNKSVQNYLYILRNDTVFDNLEDMKKTYVDGELYKTIVGTNEYAESFITSEWLYHSLKGRKNFDYTSVISGYLKSIEQILHKIVMINIDNDCKISMKQSLLEKAFERDIKVFKSSVNGFRRLSENKDGNSYRFTKYPYIDFTTAQKEYMDSSIGTFEYFLRNNKNIFLKPEYSKLIADMVSCFRTECRNGFVHTHNLNDWSLVEKTRQNAIYLYFILLGSCIIPEEKKRELNILYNDKFDELCKKIREFKRYNVNFIFEYEDGKKQKLIYDFINNTTEYTNEGLEHYEELLFYKVEDFESALEKLDETIREEQIFYLTRDNLPRKIFGVHRKIRGFEIEEILF